MKDGLIGLVVTGVVFLCTPTSSVRGQSIADQAVGSDLETIRRIVFDIELWGIEIYNCRCEASVSRETTTKEEAKETREEIAFLGNVDGNKVYTRSDIDQLDGTTRYYVSTPKGSFSGISRGGKTALANMRGKGPRVVSVIDRLSRIAFVPVRIVLTNPDYSVKTCEFTKFQADSRDCMRIEATLQHGKTPWDLMVEFTDYGRFAMTRYSLELPSAKFSGKFEYDVIDDVPTPSTAELVTANLESTLRREIEISSFEYGAVDLHEFEPEAVGIEFSPRTRPEPYWIGLMLLGLLLLAVTLTRLNRHDAKGKLKSPEGRE
jgi:hypothetical protein